MARPVNYEIRVRGQLGPEWSAWFNGLTVEHQTGGMTALKGAARDQAALHGILGRIGDLGLTLLLVRLAEEDSQD